MNRTCRHNCGRPARPGRYVCNPCRGRQWRERHRPSSWQDFDETDVELIVSDPRPVEGLTRLERVMVARGLHGRLPGEEIARVVGVTPRTVWRWAAEGWKQAAA
ncbi:hypothetical protein [Streptomyces himalayensis]|uniref:Uncharacterized protein n=1 Tax=Streptomyces himalayensis subsp. himalayensis TaxID=2756131 RepID=A0A7W0DUS3_9ACTN|nr:hypothetical protein [Streptomyces himalayensis]MBA2951629.1 hypothetical protein [Streptomyces himalayensis subsp. himalayensis]